MSYGLRLITRAAMADDARFHVAQQLNEAIETLPKAQDGTIIGASFASVSATAQMQFGDTMALLGDDGDSPVNHEYLPIATIGPGILYAPSGLERTVAIPAAGSGYVLMFRHGEDDVPPELVAGETGFFHRTVATQGQPQAKYDGGIHLSNDGPTAGDGLGAVRVGHNGALTLLTTASGHTVVLNDTAKTISVVSAGGHKVTVDDNAATQGVQILTIGGLVSHLDDVNQTIRHLATSAAYTVISGATNQIAQVADQVGIGDLVANLSAAQAAARNSDLDTLTTNLRQSIGNVCQQVAQGAITAGIPNAAAWLGVIQAGLPSLSFVDILSTVAHVTVPSCSASVFAKD